MKNNVNVDLLGNGGGNGQVAKMLLANGKLNPGTMRPFIGNDGNSYVTYYKGGDPQKPTSYVTQRINTNATLRRDEWKALDEALLEVSRQRLGGVQDLIDSGLTYNLGNAMGTTVLEYHDISDAMQAEMTMDGISRGKNDRPDFNYHYLPIPIIHVDYEINARELAASRNLGNPLDTIDAQTAARKVQEYLEDMLFSATSYSFGEKGSNGRNTIYSYVNHPDRNLVIMDSHWNDLDFNSSTASGGEKILEDVMNMMQESIDDYHYGPWKLYIPTNYQMTILKDYNKTTPGTTIRERILKLDGITGIKVIDRLPADNVLLVQMTSDVVRLVRGMGIQNVEWKSEGNMATNYKVMTIQVPQIRSDYNKRSGIVHLA
jgi:uncharacterized linocin/CFP29 family protein